MKYYIIAGEPSGDLHGANLIRGIKMADPEAQFRFWGGDKMAAEGGARNLVKHYRDTSFFGIFNVLANLRTIFRQEAECKADIEAYAPDAVILIDYPGFNMKIAAFAKKRGIKVLYYIAPKVWAWREWRVKAIRRHVDRLYSIFPFEVEYFSRHGIDTAYLGNPLLDAIESRRPHFPSHEQFATQNGLDPARPIVALLAGSRRGEIRDTLRPMAEVAARMPEYQFVVGGVEWFDHSIYDSALAGSRVKVVYGKTYELLNVSRAAIVTSGTATLETALIGTPQVVVYRIAAVLNLLRPLAMKIPYASLVNINLGRESVVELIGSRIDTNALESELRAVAKEGARREAMLADYRTLSALIGGAGSSQRTAEDMVNYLKSNLRQ